MREHTALKQLLARWSKLEEARQRIESLPVTEEALPDEQAPHPATVAELRAERDQLPSTPQGEIPF